jgi:hypothetical protein
MQLEADGTSLTTSYETAWKSLLEVFLSDSTALWMYHPGFISDSDFQDAIKLYGHRNTLELMVYRRVVLKHFFLYLSLF